MVIPIPKACTGVCMFVSVCVCLIVDEESVYSEDEEGMVSDMDVFVVSSADEDDDIQLCTCVGRAHARTCPFNPRNRGTAASKADTGSLITPTVCGAAESDILIDTEPTPSSGAGLSSAITRLRC